MSVSDERQEPTRTSGRHGELVAETSVLVGQDLAERLAAIVPGAFVEGKLDVERLTEALGDVAEDAKERYTFSWSGRREAIQMLQVPSRGSLAPDEEASVEWETTGNTFIEGDNLEVLKILYKSYFGRIKMIYIDPPYNTGNDFVYPDNFVDPLDTYLRMTGQRDEQGNLLTSNPETSGRYHSAWLTMMYPRLFLARQLLRSDGVIFVSIDDHEAHNLRLIMNEIFGEENFVAQIVVQLNPRGRHLDRFVAKTHEYVIVYARDASEQAMFSLEKDERMAREYNKADERGAYRELELRNRNPAFNSRTRPTLYYPIYVSEDGASLALAKDGSHTVEVYPANSRGEQSCWTWSRQKFERDKGILLARVTKDGSWRIFRKDYLVSDGGETATTLSKALWTDSEINNDNGKKAIQELFDGENVFDFPKSPALVEKMLLIGAKGEDLILDFFAGSGTTAQAVLDLNSRDGGSRRFICVQLPEPSSEGSVPHRLGYETLSDVARERIRRAAVRLHPETPEDKTRQGFRAFKLAESNFKTWPAITADEPADYDDQIEMFVDRLVEGAGGVQIMWETALKEGFSLSSTTEAVEIAGKTFWRVTDRDREQSFVICLEPELSMETVKELNLQPDDLFICLDRAIDDDIAANVALQARLKTL